MTRSEIFQGLKEDIKSITGETEEILEKDLLVDDLGMDSLDILELVMATESRYKLSFKDDDLELMIQWKVEQFIEYIEPLL
jgi:acyl carrier protein